MSRLKRALPSRALASAALFERIDCLFHAFTVRGIAPRIWRPCRQTLYGLRPQFYAGVPPHAQQPYSEPPFADLGEPDKLVKLDAPAFAAKVGHFLAEINAIHAFREGNGRT